METNSESLVASATAGKWKIAPPVTLKYIQRIRGRDGIERIYGRKAGLPAVRFPHPDEDFIAFMREYSAWVGTTPAPRAVEERTGTLARLIVLYKQSPRWKLLKASTQSNYVRVLDKLGRDYGAQPVRSLNRAWCQGRVDEWAKGSRFLSHAVLRCLFQTAMETGLITNNAMREVDRRPYRSDGFHAWTESDVDCFRKHHSGGTTPGLALELAIVTCQRVSDLCRLSWSMVKTIDGAPHLCFAQVKTGTTVELPIAGELAALLARCARDQPTFLTTRYGQPFTAGGLGIMFKRAVRSAKVDDRCSAHGLRKYGIGAMALAGASAMEIAAVSGHRSLTEIGRYTAHAERRKLARAAMEKVSLI